MTADERKDAVGHVLRQMNERMRKYTAEKVDMKMWELTAWIAAVGVANETATVKQEGVLVPHTEYPDDRMPWAVLGLFPGDNIVFGGVGSELDGWGGLVYGDIGGVVLKHNDADGIRVSRLQGRAHPVAGRIGPHHD